ncbi:hypothetical protein [Vibrio crassostreae]|uniref:hypothetical protein n=1 Tax=Vibrio crassostreae TaxID=246167 RepID=UPI000F4922DF|nr:hypothetical protein [Vibrio crassostreae]ROQ87768.1 hypothetical protein EDB72_1318 [Vibrio crassostreae]ROR87874.1 hypothetical protein EDB66_0812 [Vibrio crassostreae]RPF06543.1 hypothetical protein EDB17_1011 [Vibrio crassostreae]TQL45733.1 hypothetical protein FB443_101674 [Vibrio crassostreae]CAK3987949.1 conserved hypothetical protein [Vibrio crassostreae]
MKPEYLQTFFQGLIFFGAIVSAIGGWGANYFGNKAADISSKKAQTRLENTINEQSNQIKVLSQQNIDLSKINAEMSSAIHTKTDELTASGSYPIGSTAGGAEGGNKTQIVIDLIGKYAITNLMLNINVVSNYTQINGLDINTLGLNPIVLGPETLRAGEFKYVLVDTPTNETAVQIKYISNNKTWTQSFRIVKTESGRKVMSYIKDSNGVTLSKRVDDGFPMVNGKYQIWSNVVKSMDEL